MEKRGLYLPWPLHAVIGPPSPYLFLEPPGGELLLAYGMVCGLPLVPVCAGSLVRRSVAFSLERHLFRTRSHTVSWGQQCRWSEQQMAWGRQGWVFVITVEHKAQPGPQLALPQPPTRG